MMSYMKSMRKSDPCRSDTITIYMDAIRRNDNRAKAQYHPPTVMVEASCQECDDTVSKVINPEAMAIDCPDCKSPMINQRYYWMG